MFHITIFDLLSNFFFFVDYGRDINSVDPPKEPTDICSDAMFVEEAENSSSSTGSKEVTYFFILHMYSYETL
jgi:hypothetical protein